MTSSGHPVPARAPSSRLGLVVSAAFLVGVGVIATPGVADAGVPSPFAGASAGGSAAPSLVVRGDVEDDSPTGFDDVESDPDSPVEEDGDPFQGEDDGADAEDGDDSANAAEEDDDAGAVDDGEAPSDGRRRVVTAVVVDARRRTVSAPKVFAPSRAVKVSGVSWTGWNAATATGRGRVVVKRKSRRTKAVRGSGTVVLSGLKRCPGAKLLYRRATVTVAGHRVAKVTLPGCSAMR